MGEIEFKLHMNDLTTKYKLPSGFLSALQKESDWNFIIKTYTLFEAILAELITSFSTKTQLTSFFLKLDMCSKPIGKLELLKKLELLDESERKFIRSLADLRNAYAHNIKFISSTIQEMIDSFSINKKKRIIQGLSSKLNKKEEFQNNMKQCIWAVSLTLFCQINEKIYKNL